MQKHSTPTHTCTYSHTHFNTALTQSTLIVLSVCLYAHTHTYTCIYCVFVYLHPHVFMCHTVPACPFTVHVTMRMSFYIYTWVFGYFACGAQQHIKPIISAKYGSAGSGRTEGLSSNERLTKDKTALLTRVQVICGSGSNDGDLEEFLWGIRG